MNKKIIAVIIVALALVAYMIAQEVKTAGAPQEQASGELASAPVVPQNNDDETDAITQELASKSQSAFLSKEYRVKCSPCHNKDGMGPLGVSIRGQTKEEIMAKLIAYRNGEKENNLMNNLIKNISEEEMQRLAEEISRF